MSDNGFITMHVYYRLENVNLIAVSDVSERTLKKFVKKYDTKGYSDIEDLLCDPRN